MNTRWVKPPLRVLTIRRVRSDTHGARRWPGTFFRPPVRFEVAMFRAAVNAEGVEVWRFLGTLEQWSTQPAAHQAAKRLAIERGAIYSWVYESVRNGQPVMDTLLEIVRAGG